MRDEQLVDDVMGLVVIAFGLSLFWGAVGFALGYYFG